MIDVLMLKSIFDIWDLDRVGKVDLFYLNEIYYSAGLNVPKNVSLRLGQAETEGHTFAGFFDILKKVNDAIRISGEAMKHETKSEGDWSEYTENPIRTEGGKPEYVEDPARDNKVNEESIKTEEYFGSGSRWLEYEDCARSGSEKDDEHFTDTVQGEEEVQEMNTNAEKATELHDEFCTEDEFNCSVVTQSEEMKLLDDEFCPDEVYHSK
jgi:hypothetical protein